MFDVISGGRSTLTIMPLTGAASMLTWDGCMKVKDAPDWFPALIMP
jgi:hypothetical protein